MCSFAVLVCELISRPYANMSVCDDGPYILMARTLANTGHVVYNGWPAAMLGWQLYLGAVFIKLFGFSFTSVRMSTIFVAVVMAFFVQRIVVRIGVTERNATIGTLALVLSPLYLMLSATYMTDIFGLFAVMICLYGCLRALQSSTDGATIAWLCFAVAANALCGTARQIAWLGVLVMVPSTLWLLRSRRRAFFAGAAAAFAGAIFILICMLWFAKQPYIQPEHLLPNTFPIAHVLGQLTYLFLDAPFLLLPLFAIFLPQLRRATPRVLAGIVAIFLAYLFLAIYPSHLRGDFPLEPLLFNGNWVSVHGIYEGVVSLSDWQSITPLFLHTGERILLTIASLGGLAGLLVSLYHSSTAPSTFHSKIALSWRNLGVLLFPITVVNIVLLLPRATGLIFDRYLLSLLPFAIFVLVRFYQERIHPDLSILCASLVCIMAIYGVAVTHNTFSLYRARVALAAELRANGVPDTSVDNGWEYDLDVELQHANHINFPTITVPVDAYVPVTPPATTGCQMLWYNYFPHIHPIFGISFQPNVCDGPAPFAPVHYSRWLTSSPGTLYVDRYTLAPTP
ncbi:MAG: glycosyltransferase family 39 protein [Acidobacteriaceae bacterium]